MILTINNYRAISTAEIDLSTIALIAGKNEAGKTSASQALAAILYQFQALKKPLPVCWYAVGLPTVWPNCKAPPELLKSNGRLILLSQRVKRRMPQCLRLVSSLSFP